MYFHFIVEDASTEVLLHKLMEKLLSDALKNQWRVHSYRGLGNFPKKDGVNAKTGKLLNNLRVVLPGVSETLKKMPMPSVIIIVLDSDKRDPAAFQKGLEDFIKDLKIEVDHVFCLAVQEMESWLRGDKEALAAAYPNAKLDRLKNYEQDGPEANWEKLAELVYKGGIKQLKKDYPGYHGKQKSIWAERIGEHMQPERNQSPSFQHFYEEIRQRISA